MSEIPGFCPTCHKYRLKQGEVWCGNPQQLCICTFKATASTDAQFNVVGDELRKLEKKADSIFQALSEHVSSRTTVICDGIMRIESQLTALRAEADKGREALDDERKALMNGLLRIDERTRYNVQQIDALRLARAARKKKQERKRGRK